MNHQFNRRLWTTIATVLIPLPLIGQVIFNSSFESSGPTTIPPTAAEIVLAVSTSPDRARLAWLEANDNLTPTSDLTYRLHYSTQSGFTPDGTTLYAEYVGETSTEVTGLNADTDYYFRLSAKDTNGNESTFSDETSITTAGEDALIHTGAKWARAEEDLLLGQVISSTDTSLTFTWLPESILPETGQILVGEDEQGQGYLRRVLTVGSTLGGQLAITTEPASLADIFEFTNIDSNLSMFDVVAEEGSQIQRSAQGIASASNRQVWKDRLLIADQVDHSPRTGFFGASHAGSAQGIAVSEDDELHVYHPSNVITKAGENLQFEIDATIQPVYWENNEPDWDIILFDLVDVTHPSRLSENKFGASFVDTWSTTSPGGLRHVRRAKFSWNTVENDADSAAYTASFEVTAKKQDCDPWVFKREICHRTVKFNIDISVDQQGRYVVSSASSEEMGVSLDLDFTPDLVTSLQLDLLGLESAEVTLHGVAVFDALAHYRFEGSKYIDVTQPVFTRTYQSVYTAGPVPVYQEVTLSAEIRFSAEAFAAIEANAEALLEYEFDLGARYTRGGGWEDINEHNTSKSITLDLGVQGAVNAEIRLVPSIEIKFYKAATGGFSLEPYLEGHLEAEIIAEADLLNLDSFGQYRMTRLDAGFGLEGQIYTSLGVFDKTILRYPSSGSKSLFDLKFPLFSLPELSVQADTSPAVACQPAIIQGSVIDGTNNPFDAGSVRWATYPTDAAIVPSGINPLQAEFIPPSSGDYKVFFIGKGEALGNIARQFETVEVAVQEDAGGCWTLAVNKLGTGSGVVTSQPAGINCGSTCSSSFESNQAITLTAEPDRSSSFSGWSGAGCNSTDECKLTLDSLKAVTAQFDLNTTEVMEIDLPSERITVPEGDSASFQVRLTSQPENNVMMHVSHVGGDADLSVYDGENLQFTDGNWNVYQTVTLAAAEDDDKTDGEATIQLSISGLGPATLIAMEYDDDFYPLNIAVDGNPDDWLGADPLMSDTVGNPPPAEFQTTPNDFINLYVSNDNSFVYFLIEFADEISDAERSNIMAFLQIDADDNPNSGCSYEADDGQSVGAEFGLVLRTRFGDPTISSWLGDVRDCSSSSSDFPGTVTAAKNGRFFEASIPLDTLDTLAPDTEVLSFYGTTPYIGDGTSSVSYVLRYLLHRNLPVIFQKTYFEGTVQSTQMFGDAEFPNVNQGDKIWGTYTLKLDTPESDQTSEDPAFGLFFEAVSNVEINVGPYSFNNIQLDELSVRNDFDYYGQGIVDLYGIYMYQNVGGSIDGWEPDTFVLQLLDPSASVFNSVRIPETPPSPNSFNSEDTQLKIPFTYDVEGVYGQFEVLANFELHYVVD